MAACVRTVVVPEADRRELQRRGRAFCLYVVLGSYAARTRLVPRADALYRILEIG